MEKPIGDAINNIVNWFSDLPSMINDAIKDIGTWLVDAGKELINGLWKGIKSAIGNFGKWLYDNTVGAALSWLGISSPSKRFMEIGKMVSLGFQKGMESIELVVPTPKIGSLPSISTGGSTFSPVTTERGNIATSKNVTVKVEPITVNATIKSDMDIHKMGSYIGQLIATGIVKGVESEMQIG